MLRKSTGIFLLILFALGRLGLAQSSLHPEQFIRVQSDPQDIAQYLDQLNTVAKEITASEPNRALDSASKAAELARANNLPDKEAQAHKRLGLIYYREGLYDEALKAFYKSASLYQRAGDIPSYAGVIMNQGVIYRRMGNYSQAANCYLQSLKILRGLPERDRKREARVWNNLGNTYFSAKDYEQALTAFEKSMSIYDSLQLKDAAREVLMNKGVALEKMEKFAQAEELYQGIVKDIQAIQPQNANVEQEMGNVYNNLGIALFRQKKYEEAHGQFDRAYELQLRNDRTLAQMEVLNNLSMNRCAQGRFGEALEYATQVEAVVAENDIPEVEVELYRNLSDIYEGLGNSQQALSYHRKFVTLHEALLSDETIRLLAGFELEFERFLSEKEFLTQEKILAQEKFTNLLLWSGLAAAILLAILFFLGLRTNQQKRKALQVEIEHKQLANQQIILDLLHDHEVESLNAMLEGQEIERERISSELHDSLGGTLAAAKISLITLQKKLNGQDEPAYDKTEHLIDVATQEMRRISHDLAGKTLRDGGLVPALEELTSIFTHDAPFQVQLDVTGLAEGDRIDRNIEINLYRMVQELFQNIVKHAQASEVKITLNRLGDRVHMQVEDDGVGFTYDPEQASSGLGLASLKARAEKFGGSLMVKTAPGAGTMTRVQVPLV